MDVFEIGEHYIDWSSRPPVFDPQFAWHRTQGAALELRGELPPERWIHVDAGALGRDPDGVIGDLLTRLGAAADAATIAAMRGAGVSRRVRPGPYSAPFGMDFEMLDTAAATALAAAARQAAAQEGAAQEAAGGAGGTAGAGVPLPWRGDGGTLLPEVAALAARLGYTRAAGGELANGGRMVFSLHHEDSPAVMGPAS
jgi:hypothetical protein